MIDLKTKFTGAFIGCTRSLGIRLDILDNLSLFRTQSDVKLLMQFLSNCGIRFINFGLIFSRYADKQISSFAIDESILSPAMFGQDVPLKRAASFFVDFFKKNQSSEIKTEFAKFCDENEYWLDRYSLFRALIEQIGNNDFAQWPDILRVCERKTADILKKQLPEQVLSSKILQFFAHKHLRIIKTIANSFDIFLCCDCDLLCENFSTEVWSEQKAFFLNYDSQATVFAGFPVSNVCRSGMKTSKVPYRVAYLKNNRYELFERMFSNLEKLFDAVFLINGHSIFQYWEIGRHETDPSHGRWVNINTAPFFGYLSHHFNNFPFFFDFNEPLFPNNEVTLKRYNILQALIDGEPQTHSCDVYNLDRELFAISSASCGRKIGKEIPPENTTIPRAKSCFNLFKTKKFRLCIFHFLELCSVSGLNAADLNYPYSAVEKFLSFIGEHKNSRSVPAPKPQAITQKNKPSRSPSVWGKFAKFFSKKF